eukprot:PhF_6_TR26325/c0_g1_i3/m.37849
MQQSSPKQVTSKLPSFLPPSVRKPLNALLSLVSQSRYFIIYRNTIVMFCIRMVVYLLTARQRLLKGNVLLEALRTSARWSIFVAGLSCMRKVQQYISKNKNSVATTAVAGFVCALPASFALHDSTREELSLYLLTRAFHGAVTTTYFQERILGPKLSAFPHYDVVAMCASSAQLLGALLYSPHTHSRGYLKFLELSMGKDPRVVQAVANWMHLGGTAEGALEYCSQHKFQLPHWDPTALHMCDWYHPETTSCLVHYIVYIARHFTYRCLPLYFPLKVILALVFNPNKVIAHPANSLYHVIQSTIQSSAFLSMYCANAVCVLCLANHQVGRMPWPLAGSIMGIAAGFATFIEPKSRRLDLALYCGMQAVRSSWNTLMEWGYAPKLSRRWLGVLLAGCISYLFVLYDQNKGLEHTLLHNGVVRTFQMLLNESNSKKKKESEEEIEKNKKDPGELSEDDL